MRSDVINFKKNDKIRCKFEVKKKQKNHKTELRAIYMYIGELVDMVMKAISQSVFVCKYLAFVLYITHVSPIIDKICRYTLPWIWFYFISSLEYFVGYCLTNYDLILLHYP